MMSCSLKVRSKGIFGWQSYRILILVKASFFLRIFQDEFMRSLRDIKRRFLLHL